MMLIKRDKRNEEIFNQELVVLEYLIYEYKKELKRTNLDNGKEYKTTKKTRLKRLRLEINKVLKQIENELPMQIFSVVEEYD